MTLSKPAQDFMDEWIEVVKLEDIKEAKPNVCMSGLFSITDHLGIEWDITSEIQKSLKIDPSFSNPVNIFYLGRWKKELSCDIKYHQGSIDYIKPFYHPYAYPTYEQEVLGIWKPNVEV